MGQYMPESQDREEFERRAEGGDAEAMTRLGLLHEKVGDVVPARQWWEKAAALGNETAMFNLGQLELIYSGDADARVWFVKAAELGHADAAYEIGVIDSGAGDTNGARAWFEKAAELGHKDVLFVLAGYATGDGDSLAADAWLQKSAGVGDARAICRLGTIARESGDMESARELFVQAAELGNDTALNEIARLNAIAAQVNALEKFSPNSETRAVLEWLASYPMRTLTDGSGVPEGCVAFIGTDGNSVTMSLVPWYLMTSSEPNWVEMRDAFDLSDVVLDGAVRLDDPKIDAERITETLRCWKLKLRRVLEWFENACEEDPAIKSWLYTEQPNGRLECVAGWEGLVAANGLESARTSDGEDFGDDGVLLLDPLVLPMVRLAIGLEIQDLVDLYNSID